MFKILTKILGVRICHKLFGIKYRFWWYDENTDANNQIKLPWGILVYANDVSVGYKPKTNYTDKEFDASILYEIKELMLNKRFNINEKHDKSS